MITPGYILLSVPLAAMVVSDFRRREVAVVWMAAFGAGCVAISLWQHGWQPVLQNVLQNLILLAYLAAGLVAYVSLKNRRLSNPLSGWLGAGDVAFLLCLTPMFGAREYLLFLVVSLCLTLAGWGIYHAVTRKHKTIPLVGALGITFCLYMVMSILIKWN